MPACTRTATSGASASCSWSRSATSATDRSRSRHFALGSNSEERLRILGEFPVRKFGKDGKQPLDPDGNPDTSFLAKIPADVAWTFQTLDNNGMVLNMAQTWHQVRPGEIRNNCGGCHAHSQKPTALRADRRRQARLPGLGPDARARPCSRPRPTIGPASKWDVQDRTGVRFAKGVKDVEFYRDVKPILERSCVACHTIKHDKPAGRLALDDDRPDHQVRALPRGTSPGRASASCGRTCPGPTPAWSSIRRRSSRGAAR